MLSAQPLPYETRLDRCFTACLIDADYWHRVSLGHCEANRFVSATQAARWSHEATWQAIGWASR